MTKTLHGFWTLKSDTGQHSQFLRCFLKPLLCVIDFSAQPDRTWVPPSKCFANTWCHQICWQRQPYFNWGVGGVLWHATNPTPAALSHSPTHMETPGTLFLSAKRQNPSPSYFSCLIWQKSNYTLGKLCTPNGWFVKNADVGSDNNHLIIWDITNHRNPNNNTNNNYPVPTQSIVIREKIQITIQRSSSWATIQLSWQSYGLD